MQRSKEQVRGWHPLEVSAAAPHSCFTLSGSPAGALEVEMEEGTNRSPSRDPLTPEPQDPAPKKKKKKRAATIGNNLFMTNVWRPNPLRSYGSSPRTSAAVLFW